MAWIPDDMLVDLYARLDAETARADRAEVERDSARRIAVDLDGRLAALRAATFGADWDEKQREHLRGAMRRRERMTP